LTLSDGQRAAVVEHHADDPCRPSVALTPAVPQQDAQATRAPIDLREKPDLTVVEHEGFNVADHLFKVPGYLKTSVA
jgi:hypothetical protein